MVKLFAIAQIFNSPGYPGVLSSALIEIGIPFFTPEVGNARSLNRSMIPFFVEGTMNVLKLHSVIQGPMGRTGQDLGIFVGNSAFPMLATSGGLVKHLVGLAEPMVSGQNIAIRRNMFGEIVAEYTSPVNGEIGVLCSDATSEPGNVLAFILFNESRPQGIESYPESRANAPSVLKIAHTHAITVEIIFLRLMKAFAAFKEDQDFNGVYPAPLE